MIKHASLHSHVAVVTLYTLQEEVGMRGHTERRGIQTGASNASGTSYQLTSTGWVGITTYTDMHGNARVKKETLVAMSGITTSVAYPPA